MRCGNTQRQFIFEGKDTGTITSAQPALNADKKRLPIRRQSAHSLSGIYGKINNYI